MNEQENVVKNGDTVEAMNVQDIETAEAVSKDDKADNTPDGAEIELGMESDIAAETEAGASKTDHENNGLMDEKPDAQKTEL